MWDGVERLRLIVENCGGTSAVSSKSGQSVSSINNWLRGTEPKFTALSDIVKATGYSFDWLATGEGPMHPGETTVAADTDFLSAPRYDAEASCGAGAFVDEAPVLNRIPFTKEFMNKKLGRNDTKGLILLDARGDSMEPTINDGGLIMVDTDKTSLTSAIYAFSYDGALFVKRLNHLPGAVEARSDNKEYPPFVIDKHDMDNFRVIGRVVWVGHMI